MFHYTTQKVNTFIASNMSRKASITVPDTYAQKRSTRDREKSITLTSRSYNNTAETLIYRSYSTHNSGLKVVVVERFENGMNFVATATPSDYYFVSHQLSLKLKYILS